MWSVVDNPDHSRGGFQNRDVGKTSFNKDFGPDHGIDYARFSDPPDYNADKRLKEKICLNVTDKFGEIINLEVIVRNGFIILKGDISSEENRKKIEDSTKKIEGVREVINQFSIKYN